MKENGYCVMMVLADSKNMIKISFSSSHSIILRSFFLCCYVQQEKTKKKKKKKKEKNRFSCVRMERHERE